MLVIISFKIVILFIGSVKIPVTSKPLPRYSSGKCADSEARLPGTGLHHLQVPWTSFFIFLHYSFPLCKMKLMKALSSISFFRE